MTTALIKQFIVTQTWCISYKAVSNIHNKYFRWYI